MAIDRSAPDAVSGMTNKEVDAKIASAKTEGHAAGVAEGKSQAETAAKATTEAAVTTAKADATKAANERVKAIMALDETKGREASALQLALTTDLSVDAIKPVLAGLPKATAGDGTRSSDSPLGIALNGDKKAPGASDILSPDEVAAKVNGKK